MESFATSRLQILQLWLCTSTALNTSPLQVLHSKPPFWLESYLETRYWVLYFFDLLGFMAPSIEVCAVEVFSSVACRGLVMPRATAWLDAPLLSSSIEQWRMVVLLLDLRCLWRHNMTSHSRFQTNVLAKFVDATCIFRDAGAAVGQGSSNRVEGNGNLSKTKKRYKVCLFLLSTILTSKIITKITENHSKFSGCANSCNKFVSGRCWQNMKSPMMLLSKDTSVTVSPFWKVRGAIPPPCLHPLASLCISRCTLFTRWCRLQCVVKTRPVNPGGIGGQCSPNFLCPPIFCSSQKNFY